MSFLEGDGDWAVVDLLFFLPPDDDDDDDDDDDVGLSLSD
jgi:hypothetical protein